MARNIVQNVTLIDDMDGKVLPEGTEPVILSWDGRAVSAYLSEQNRDKVSKYLSKILENAETYAPVKPSSGTGRSRDELAALRAWARHEGYDVGERGRIASDVLTAWDDAGQPGWGHGTVTNTAASLVTDAN